MLSVIVTLFGLLFTTSAFSADIAQEYKYQVLVKTTVNGVEYKDAIYYTPSEWETLKQADVDAEITKRTDNFRNALENPAPVYEPTKEELEAAKAQLVAQVADLDARIVTAKPKSEKLIAEEIIA